MGKIYETKNDVPQWVREYLEAVSQESWDALELHEVNDYLYHLEDWINQETTQHQA